eukprot:11677472-Karenia_brevis.AAC.1
MLAHLTVPNKDSGGVRGIATGTAFRRFVIKKPWPDRCCQRSKPPAPFSNSHSRLGRERIVSDMQCEPLRTEIP